MSNGRIANASFVSALAVVAIHLPWAPPFVATACRFSFPFFFLVSGFFLAVHIDEVGWFRRECAKRVRSLPVPYLLWSLLFALVVFLGSRRGADALPIGEWFAGKKWTIFGFDTTEVPLLAPAVVFLLYLMHYFITHTASVTLVPYRGTGLAIAVYVAAIALPLFGAWLLSRCLPQVASILFGGRLVK